MQLFYLGGPTLKIKHETSVTPDGEATILINPRGAVSGLPKLKKQHADIVLVSVVDSAYYDETTHDNDSFVVTSPGEYEIKDVLIGSRIVPGTTPMHVFRLDLEMVSLGYLGGIGTHHDRSVIQDTLEGVDILVVPVGGHSVLPSGEALKLVSSLEPRIVIPIEYKTKEFSVKNDTVDSFLKECGVKDSEVQKKIKIQKKDLPANERQIVVLA